jgi:hypothetical protein
VQTRPCSESLPGAPDARLVAFVQDRFERRLANYKNIPDEVRDHHETEIDALAGGYSYRQVLELVQNAADAPSAPLRLKTLLKKRLSNCREASSAGCRQTWLQLAHHVRR